MNQLYIKKEIKDGKVHELLEQKHKLIIGIYDKEYNNKGRYSGEIPKGGLLDRLS